MPAWQLRKTADARRSPTCLERTETTQEYRR